MDEGRVLFDTVGPVSRLAVKMCDGDYNNRIFVDAVDHSVGEAREQASPDARFDFGCRLGESPDQLERPIQTVEEIQTQILVWVLFVIPRDSVINFSLRRIEKTNVH